MQLQYLEGNTFLHRLDPRTKFLWGILIMAWLSVMFQPVLVLTLGVMILLTAKLGGLSIVQLVRTSVTIGIASVGMVITQGLLYPGQTVIFTLGPLHPTTEGLLVGLGIALRILSLVSASTLIAKTTSPRDIFLSLVRLGMPYKIAYMLFTALRFVPMMGQELATIRDAQFVRGIAQQKGGILSKFRQWSVLMVPFIAVGIRRAEHSAIAMEVKAFGLYPDRTYLHDMRATDRGLRFLIPWIAAFVLYLLITKGNIVGVVSNFLPQ